MSAHGHVDVVGDGVIEGWVYRKDKPNTRCSVIAMQNGQVLSETTADAAREDLRSKGIGDGRHGFALKIPASLTGDAEIQVLEKHSETPLIGSPVTMRTSRGTTKSEQSEILLVDLSDMIFYLENHDHLSGIQRVQANVFQAITENRLWSVENVRVVFYKEDKQEFYEIPVSFVNELIEDTAREVSGRRYQRDANGNLHLEHHARVAPLALNEREAKNASLILLGAAWVFPNYFHAVRALKRRGVRFIPLLHDLIPIVMPSMCDKGTAEVFKIFIRKAVRNADAVLTVSENTRQDLVSFCDEMGIECPPATVARNGQMLSATASEEAEVPISDDFVLFVSTIEGRKNHWMALKVWQRLVREKGRDAPTLVLVGRLGWRVEAFVEELYRSDFVDQKIVILSDVSDAQLAALYRKCLFTIYPTLYEGWGLPVGESLAFGKVCVASNASSVPEVGGDFPVYIDPNSFDDAYKNVRSLVDDPKWRQKLERRIAKEFSPITWKDTGSNIVDAADRALKKEGRSPTPTVPPGEYNFARVEYLESNVVHGDEVARHWRRFSEPHFMSERLNLDSYVLAEETLYSGYWHAPEHFGRWGHFEGNTIAFRAPSAETSYMAYLLASVPPPYLPAVLELSCMGRVIEAKRVENEAVAMCLDTTRFKSGDQVRITVRVRERQSDGVPGDPRQLGVGFCRMALVDSSDIAARLRILEGAHFVTA